MNKLPVFFRPEMVADGQSYSPSAHKPLDFMRGLITQKIPHEIIDFEKLSPAAMCSDGKQKNYAHDLDYVAGVLRGKIQNGFGNTSAEVALALPYTTGAMCEAAFYALEQQLANAPCIVCAPCSGFHHACYDQGGGFCTFNGLCIALVHIHQQHPAHKLAILDCDAHYGNGTDDIMSRWKPAMQEQVLHYTFAYDTTTHGNQGTHSMPVGEAAFLRNLPRVLETLRDRNLILYQAGADPHVNDPLGGWLSTEGMRKRDRMVFRFAVEHNIPLVWNLAGGYQRDSKGGINPVIELHMNTAQECLAAQEIAVDFVHIW